MWHILNILKGRKPEEPTIKTPVKKLTCLSLPLRMECKNTRTRSHFHLTCEQMTTTTMIYITPHYLDPGDKLDLTISPTLQLPGARLNGRVMTCIPRKATGFIAFEGVIELQARGGLNLEIFRLHAESQNTQARYCA